MLSRRSFLTALAALPFIGKWKPFRPERTPSSVMVVDIGMYRDAGHTLYVSMDSGKAWSGRIIKDFELDVVHDHIRK